MSHNHTAIPASYLLLRKDNHILLMRRKGTEYFDGWYSVPAGHVEEGELPRQAIVREAKEEVGIDVSLTDVHFVFAAYRTKSDHTGDRADYFFEARIWKGEPSIQEPDKCDDVQWFSLDALPENIVPHLSNALHAIQKNEHYAEFGLDRIVKSPTIQN